MPQEVNGAGQHLDLGRIFAISATNMAPVDKVRPIDVLILVISLSYQLVIEVRHLRYFVVLAEELHFGHAAERLHIAQPGLSQQIQALESELGVSLLTRTHRRVELTAAGRALLEEGRRALAQFERAENLSRRIGSGELGRLNIGSTESAAWDVLPTLIRKYRERYSNVDLMVVEATSAIQVDALKSGELDVGFVRTPVVNTEGLAARMIRQEGVAVLLPETHRLAQRKTIPLTALAEEPLIIHPTIQRPSWADFIISLCRSAGFEPRVAQEATRSTTAASFVAAGLGLTLMPESMKRMARSGVAYRLLADPAPRTSLLLVYRSDPVPPTVSGLLRIAQDLWPDLKNARRNAIE